MARNLKFRIEEEEKVYYPCRENKGADQLRGNLRLCFRICRLLVFSNTVSPVCPIRNMELILTENILFSDFNQLDKEISTIRTNLKPKVNKLRDLEHREDIKGFDLNPLSQEELKTIDSFI